MRRFALSAIGYDKPGIVAAVTERLLEHSVNIEDSQMTIMRGHFTMTLLLAASQQIDAERLRDDLEGVCDRLRLDAIALNELSDADPGEADADAGAHAAGANAAADVDAASHVVTVYGADHPGIVHSVCAALAERGINISDLTTRLVEPEVGATLYVLMMEISLTDMTLDELRALLEPVGRKQAVEVSIQPVQRELL